MSPSDQSGSQSNAPPWPGRRLPQIGMARTSTPITGTTSHRIGFFVIPRLRNRNHCTNNATFVTVYMTTTPKIPKVERNPTVVPGSVTSVDSTPITMLGTTNAIAAAHGVLNLGCTELSPRGQRPPRAPAKITREVCVFAAMYELVTLTRKTAARIGTITGRAMCRKLDAAVANGLLSLASFAPSLPKALTTAQEPST